MQKYAVMQNPGHNRVYFNSSGQLAKNELAAAFSAGALPGGASISEESLGGVEYICFESPELSERALISLSRLSFVYAVFEVHGEMLRPVLRSHSYYFPDDLNMILKYSGKTNELFTRMMINLAVFASKFGLLDNLNMLDPVSGKGTGVFDGLICGYNSHGIEISEKLAGESAQFFKKYLENGRYKHAHKKERFSGPGFKSQRYFFECAKSKGDKKLACEFICGDSANAGKYYKKNFFNIIAGDLPYGVQHDNSAFGNKMRNPAELIGACLPAWLEVLKPGGGLALSWNTFLLKRELLEREFAAHGLELIDFGDFSHRVDQAIMRDLIVARK